MQITLHILVADSQIMLAGSCVAETACADMNVEETSHFVHLATMGKQTNNKNIFNISKISHFRFSLLFEKKKEEKNALKV